MAGAVTSAFAIFISTFSPNVPFLMFVYGVLGNYILAAFFLPSFSSSNRLWETWVKVLTAS
jgi:hypothetical protein